MDKIQRNLIKKATSQTLGRGNRRNPDLLFTDTPASTKLFGGFGSF